MAYASDVTVGDEFSIDGAVTIVSTGAKVYIPMDDLVDRAAELARLQKELDNVNKQLNAANAKLNNEKFTGKAPEAVVAGVRANAEKLAAQAKLIEESMAALK